MILKNDLARKESKKAVIAVLTFLNNVSIFIALYLPSLLHKVQKRKMFVLKRRYKRTIAQNIENNIL